jgi:hypothetical protein
MPHLYPKPAKVSVGEICGSWQQCSMNVGTYYMLCTDERLWLTEAEVSCFTVFFLFLKCEEVL